MLKVIPFYFNANISEAEVPVAKTLITCKGTYELLPTFFKSTGSSLEAGITLISPAVPTNKLKPSLPDFKFAAPPLPLYISKAAPPPTPGADKVKASSLTIAIT